MPNSMPETPSFGPGFSYAEMEKLAQREGAAETLHRETQRHRVIETKPKEIPTGGLKIKDLEASLSALAKNIAEVEGEIRNEVIELPSPSQRQKITELEEELTGYKRELEQWESRKKAYEAETIGFEEAEEFGRKLEEQARPAEPEIITDVTDERGVPQAIAFPMREQPAEEPALVVPKKSWFAPIRKWGTRALVAFGLIAAAKPAAEEMERLGQAASQTYADYEKGIQGFVESSPRMREGATKETAERLVAGQPVEIGGKTVQLPTPETGSARPAVDQDRFLRQNLPRMVEQARKTLGVESGLPAGYSETSFLNDQQTFQHFAKFGPGKNITMEVASKALGNMIKYNREKARAVIAQETRNQAAAQQAVDRIFGEKI